MERDYELVTIWNPDLAEDGMNGGVERVSTLIGARGGEITDTNVWGRRSLAYPINRHNEGTYVIMQVRLDPRRASDLESQLRLNEDIIRHLLIRKDE